MTTTKDSVFQDVLGLRDARAMQVLVNLWTYYPYKRLNALKIKILSFIEKPQCYVTLSKSKLFIVH